MRRVDPPVRKLGRYHQDPGTKAIHWICVPLIVGSVLGMLWAASPPAALAVIAAAILFYLLLSVPLACGMLAVLAAMALGADLVRRWPADNIAGHVRRGVRRAIHRPCDRRKPAFVEDLRSFLVAPAWLVSDLYRRRGLRY